MFPLEREEGGPSVDCTDSGGGSVGGIVATINRPGWGCQHVEATRVAEGWGGLRSHVVRWGESLN